MKIGELVLGFFCKRAEERSRKEMAGQERIRRCKLNGEGKMKGN